MIIIISSYEPGAQFQRLLRQGKRITGPIVTELYIQTNAGQFLSVTAHEPARFEQVQAK